jgi:hypothetical protein
MNRCIFVATSLFTALVSPASFAQEINIGEPVWIPMTTASESRVATALELEATLYKPEGLGILHDRYYSTEAIKSYAEAFARTGSRMTFRLYALELWRLRFFC